MGVRERAEAIRHLLGRVFSRNQTPAPPVASADVRMVNWLAGEIADRADMPFLDVLHLLVGVTAQGGPDIRTRQGWAHASVLLGVPGHPLMPTLH